MDNVFTYIVSLPDNVNEMVTPCADGYTIYLSDRLDSFAQRKAFLHAVGHILNRDFDTEKIVEVIEDKNHGG